ncbi:cob(I)alamin adenosyltransferase [Acetitomaculum ruminis DSM 5522]|uniref:Cob(I)alamin adenosyltransferase n=1 Tax=Acetitomaculum ruminis DSM 5522 TaxID=1120918 RepID=A0A1I0WY37_9FIRM|nr:cob(I)yrinic acid a,c-diamide adenosyltransferase [Acetitomaculum ruminis]SFA92813.1 cob(I)alamin adenosyltransferase [Acetitomaculum ruminis DSM 5522]
MSEEKKGLIHIYTGDGKGKTTACVGLTVRCAGSGRKVVFSQFLKDNKSSELNILRNIDNIYIVTCDKSFGFIFNMSEEKKAEAKKAYSQHLLNVINKVKEVDADMVVFDEMIASYNYEMIDREVLLDFLKNKPEKLEVVMSGREPAEELVNLANYVSEIKKVKHPFDEGIPSRPGIEK